MNHEQQHTAIEELLGAYALDAVDEPDRRRIEAHLAECDQCRAEVDGHRAVAATLGGESIDPPEGVWTGLLDQIRADSPGEGLAPVVPLESRRRWASAGPAAWMASAAAIAVVVLGAALFAQSGRINDLNAEVTAQEQQIAALEEVQNTDPLQLAVSAALSDPGAQVANLTADGEAGAMLIVVLPDGTGYVYQNTLEELPDDFTYQLWAVVDDKVISAGVLGSQPEIVPFHIDREGLQGLVITQEIAGGVPQSEEAPVVAWFDA